jgi:ATP-dependent Clp protease ATP-binding subunit ClpC
MQLANQEAHRFNHEYVGTEHILLGLVQEGSGVAANVLRNLDIDLRKVRLEIERIVQHGPGGEPVASGRLPCTPRSKKLIDHAIAEARALNHSYVGTEHLLLGMLREQEGVAAQVLMNLGLKLEDVREEVLNLLGHNLSVPPVGPLTPADEPEVHVIPKSLRDEGEGYPLSDFVADETPLTAASPSDEQLESLRGLIRRLEAQADRNRDQAQALRALLAWYESSRGRG